MWNRRHPAFAGVAALGLLHQVVRRRASEALLNNWIDRHSYVDPHRAVQEPVGRTDWLCPPRGRTDWHQRVARHVDLRGRLGQIDVPTLLVCGRQDPVFPLSCSRELAAGIPRARLVVFEHSGHFPHEEEAASFEAVVARFLDGGG
jgi:pimeloyl-ACP methyl ester carboxylesterase